MPTRCCSKTQWFVESPATQVLVMFVIRTRRGPLSRGARNDLVCRHAHGADPPFTGLGRCFRFQPPPGEFFVMLAALVVAYPGIVEGAKCIFYRHLTMKSK